MIIVTPQMVTIEYIDAHDECRQMKGILVKYCIDGDVVIQRANGARKKGMPVQFH